MAARIPKLLPSLFLPEPYLSPLVIAEALLAVILLAFLSVILPALRLRRLDVAAILSGRT
jgi:ABC-type antimicrobial peptide transport system permease subunit